MEERCCKNCRNGFLPNKHNQLYCLQLQTASCELCSETFERICERKLKQTCSRSCSGRLIRKQQAHRSVAVCITCGDNFHQKITAQVYCYKPLSVICEGGCGSTVLTACTKSPKRFCTPTCRQLHMRATSYTMTAKNCVICGDSFTPQSSKSMVCTNNHKVDCIWCSEAFIVDIQSWSEEGKGKYCSNTCSTLGQTRSRLRRELTAEYKAINQWALKFSDDNGRKPAILDVYLYFGVGIPARANRDLFEIQVKGESGFEKHIVRLIAESWPHLKLLRNKKPLRSIEGRRLEIDIWLPELAIGFEVQDFSTHSRDSDNEPSPMPWAELKRGPTYHSSKMEAADRFGVKIFEIWEDDILEGRAKHIVESAIAGRARNL